MRTLREEKKKKRSPSTAQENVFRCDRPDEMRDGSCP